MSVVDHPALAAHLKRDAGDNDVRQTARFLDELPPLGQRILVVGCNEEPLANILADLGYWVVGLDLAPYNHGAITLPEYPQPKYLFRREDALLSPLLNMEWDAAVSTSAIEHFGLPADGGVQDAMGDVWIMRRLYGCLKPGGRVYLTVPIGASHTMQHDNWRRYTTETFRERLQGPFGLERFEAWFTAGRTEQGQATVSDLATYEASADLSAVAVLRKG